MKAVVYKGQDRIALAEVPDPEIETPTDAVVGIETTSMCGLDIHAVHGTLGKMRPGTIIGHEGTAIVERLGSDVRDLKEGDRVAVCSTIACGWCASCKAGNYSMCDTVQDRFQSDGCSFFGGPEPYGGVDGLQAEKARIPFANVTLVKLPDDVSDDQALFLSDLFPAGYFAAESASVRPNQNVAVFGCGPVGQFAIASAKLLGAGRVIGLDSIGYRLDMARRQGAEVVDLETEDPVETIRRLTGGFGADRVIDAVGVDVHHWHPLLSDGNANADDIFNDAGYRASTWAIRSAAKGGTVTLVGVYPREVKAYPIGEAMRKNITIKTGHCNHRKYVPRLIELIQNGTVDPLEIYTHKTPFTGVRDAYEAVKNRDAGWIRMERFYAFSKPI